ncbi:hypothetical protein EYF80_058673 [Liparis tanakae]|uniref:Uncharacterized protein n=1 Tax=Liparis tanakae TaxID=230148 RepID=A0A4Z2EQS5_9TELE|nr:hypothetical protein EYF80_058673 [Liparis tanakae]
MDHESLDSGTTGVTLKERERWSHFNAAPGVVEDGVLVAGHRGVQLLQHDLHAAAAVHEAPDVVHHGSLTVHAGAVEHAEREVILAIKVHGDNPADDKQTNISKIHKKPTRTEILYGHGVSHVNGVYHGLTQGLGALLD